MTILGWDGSPEGKHIFVCDEISAATTTAMDMLRGMRIQHVVFLDGVDVFLASFACNFGITFSERFERSLLETLDRILVVGPTKKRDKALQVLA